VIHRPEVPLSLSRSHDVHRIVLTKIALRLKMYALLVKFLHTNGYCIRQMRSTKSFFRLSMSEWVKLLYFYVFFS
jgi:hypothetical protein